MRGIVFGLLPSLAAATIFGVSTELPLVTGHVIFICFFLFLICLEKVFAFLDEVAERQGLSMLFEKLKMELMVHRLHLPLPPVLPPLTPLPPHPRSHRS